MALSFNVGSVQRILGSEVADIAGVFVRRYGLERDGAALVRPDRFIAWRARSRRRIRWPPCGARSIACRA